MMFIGCYWNGPERFQIGCKIESLGGSLEPGLFGRLGDDGEFLVFGRRRWDEMSSKDRVETRCALRLLIQLECELRCESAVRKGAAMVPVYSVRHDDLS